MSVRLDSTTRYLKTKPGTTSSTDETRLEQLARTEAFAQVKNTEYPLPAELSPYFFLKNDN